MAMTLSIEIDDEMAEFVDEQLAKGQYRSFDEMVDRGLELLRQKMELAATKVTLVDDDESENLRN